MDVDYIPTEDNQADVFTKSLTGTLFASSVTGLGLVDSPATHWGRGALETSGNILGKLQALDHFPPNVSTNHIWSTFGI